MYLKQTNVFNFLILLRFQNLPSELFKIEFLLEQFSLEHRKTKEITSANHEGCNNDPIRTRSKYT